MLSNDFVNCNIGAAEYAEYVSKKKNKLKLKVKSHIEIKSWSSFIKTITAALFF